ncbi:MAG TPA: hypothetical protein VF519_08630 [Mycobacteriales bacterium]|jgi:hypothetical protein
MHAWADLRPPAVVPLLAIPAQPVPTGATDCPDVAVLGELCDIGADVGGFITNPIGTITGGVGTAAVKAVTDWVIDGAVWFLGQVAAVVSATTKVEPTAAWFTRNYTVMAGIAVVIALPLLLTSLIGAVINGDPARLGRAVAMVFAAGLGTFAAVAVTGLLLAITDDLSAHIAGGLNADLTQALQGVGTGLTAAGGAADASQPGTGAAVPLFAGFLAAIVIVIAAIGVWLELLLRQVAIYATLLFFPLALAGLIWPATSRWARRLTEILVSLILAKLVIVALLSLGAAGLSSGGEGFSGVIAGAAMLVLALFSPWVVMRIVGIGQLALAGTGIEGMRSRATHTATHRTHQATDTMRAALGGSRGGAAGAGGSGLTVAGPGGGTAAAGGAGAVAGGVLAAAHHVKQQGQRALATTGAAIGDPYAPPPGGKPGGGHQPQRPPVHQVEARLGE